MNFIDTLKDRLASEESVFRAQLLREDVARLERLEALASEASSLEEFVKQGAMVGWTQGDLMTHRVSETLTPFLTGFYASAHGTGDDEALRHDWQIFCNDRMEKLVKCL